MNIRQAIDRVSAIDAKLDSIRRFIEAGWHIGGDIKISSGTWTINLNALLSADERASLLDRECLRLEAERDKLQSFIDGGMPEDCAKQAVTLIAKGAIPAISINY